MSLAITAAAPVPPNAAADSLFDFGLRLTRPDVPIAIVRVGTGARGAICGEVRRLVCPVDPAGHPPKDVPIHCNRRDCPECFRRWAMLEALGALARLKAGARFYTLHRGLRHVTLSMDGATVPSSLRALERERRAVYAVLARMGFLGGAAVYHPQRHEGASCWWDSPHWHVVGYGRVDADKRPSGWFVKTISGSEAERRSWVGTLYYVLNHCGFARWSLGGKEHTTEALTWFGGWSYNKLPSRFAPGRDTTCTRSDFCVVCGAEMVPEETLNLREYAPRYGGIPHGPPPWAPSSVSNGPWNGLSESE